MSRTMSIAQMSALLNHRTNEELGVNYHAYASAAHVYVVDCDGEWTEDWHLVGSTWFCTDTWSQYGIGMDDEPKYDAIRELDEPTEPTLPIREPMHGMLGWTQMGSAKLGGQKKRRAWGRDSIRKLSEQDGD